MSDSDDIELVEIDLTIIPLGTREGFTPLVPTPPPLHPPPRPPFVEPSEGSSEDSLGLEGPPPPPPPPAAEGDVSPPPPPAPLAEAARPPQPRSGDVAEARPVPPAPRKGGVPPSG